MSRWNPLLGERPTSLYAALEALAKEKGEPYGLLPPQVGVKHTRWPFRHDGDGLVHALMGLHATLHWQVSESGAAPVEAITECGVLALLKSSQPAKIPQYDSGVIAPTEHLTCLRCASGVDGEGLRYRQTQKNRNFSNMYGMSSEHVSKLTNTSQPNMQQVPRKPR
jgi:hypothetical protein